MRKAPACLLFLCALPAFAQIVTTPAIGGFPLSAGGCFTQPVTYTGAAVGSTVFTVNPETFAGPGIWWQAYVSAPNQVTVKVCAGISGYVNAAVYDVGQSSGGATGVTAVTATAPITSSGGTTPNISATYQGNGAKIQSSTGTTTTNDCVKFDAAGNTVDSGGACAAGTVTAVSATAPLTSSGGATPNISATYQGNGAKVQASTGSTTGNDCVKFDASGNTVDAGAPCASGGVSTVSATAPLTSSGGTTPNISATYQGNGAMVQASTGTTTTNDCVKFDAAGNTVDSGGPCATGTVTAVTATGPLTSSGGATPNISATYQGNGAKIQASTGTTTTNDCVKFDANGNTVDSGAACASGGGPTTQNVVTGSRSFNTVFHNTTGKALWVSVGTSSTGTTVSNNVLTDSSNPPTTSVGFNFNTPTTSGNFVATMTFIVLPGNFYEITASAGNQIAYWVEWS
jgi:hypothetical protein